MGKRLLIFVNVNFDPSFFNFIFTIIKNLIILPLFNSGTISDTLDKV
jgi:hypothetical protein